MILETGKIIYDLLTSNLEVKSLVDNRIYPLIADVDTQFPFIVYKRNGVSLDNSKDRFGFNESAFVEIVIASDRYEDSITVAEAVRKALEHKRGLLSNISVSDIVLEDASEDYIENTFIQQLNFKIKFK